MAGFCLQVRTGERESASRPLHPVDMGASDAAESFVFGLARLSWSYRTQSRQWWTRRQDGRLLLIAGQPDRYPAEEESLDHWLDSGRWGSYHGFEVTTEKNSVPEVCVFVDPLSTRPLYFHLSSDGLLIADKLATIAVHAPNVEPNWPALLEALALGSVYTPDTTLSGVEELAAGEAVDFRGADIVRRRRFAQPLQEDIDRDSVRQDPAGTLLRAMKYAVAETWSDPGTWLLLSGGLDSRLVALLAGPGRKALTLDLYKNETGIARELAACCGDELVVLPHLHSDFVTAAELAVPVGGAMHDPHFFNNLGMGVRWRERGISSVSHAYLFDTLLKGFFLLPAGAYSRSLLSRSMPRTAVFFERVSGRGSALMADDVIMMLSPWGKEMIQSRLSALDSTFATETEDGLDITFENRVLGAISRQIHYGGHLGWCEELDVQSPIFHQALWTWRAHSRAADREGGRAFVKMLLSIDHDVLKVVDSNTGAPPRMPVRSWREAVRRNGLYQRVLQPIWSRLAKGEGRIHFGTGLGDCFRKRLDFLDEGLAEMEGHELLDSQVMQSYRERFLAGNDRFLEPLLVCGSIGRWKRLVREKSTKN